MLDILMITHKRPEYTRRALARLLGSCDERMQVWVWHNGTDRATLQVVETLSTHPRFHRLHVSPENKRLREPTNWFWSHAQGDYVSKVDDDCLLPDGWGQTLMKAHEANPKLGVIGTWRFYDEDFVPSLANQKIRALNGGHSLMRNCWVQGSGYVMKRACVKELGLLRSDESFPGYCVRSARAGWENGWYYPFIHEEHMDDPRSPFCAIKTDAEFMAQRPLSAIQDNVQTLDEWAARVRYMARIVQEASPDPRDHTGWRRRLRSVPGRLKRWFGVTEPWRQTTRPLNRQAVPAQ
jgi:hypothetical protein